MNNRNNDFGIVGSNVFYYIFNGIFTGVSQFLFLSFLGRYLSPANFGSTSFIYQLATFMAVFSLLGLDVAFQRETYSIFIKNEKEGLNLVLKYSSKRILLGIIAISAVLISFSVIFQKLMNEILITIILIPLFLLRTLLNSIFIGFEKGKYLLFTNIVGWTAILSLIFYFRFIN